MAAIIVQIQEGSSPHATVTSDGETTRLHPEIRSLQALQSAVDKWIKRVLCTAVADGKRVDVSSKYLPMLRQEITQIVVEE